MGHRVNYIIKDFDKLRIHYNHWRADSIAADLYLGERRFLEFLNNCKRSGVVMDEPWIEGCVIIDRNVKHLYFWTTEFSKQSSVIDYYISQLAKRWRGWQITFLTNKMYDVEKVLCIEYIKKQCLPTSQKCSEEIVANDTTDEWETAVIIIKEGDNFAVTKTGNLNIEQIIAYGVEIISLLKNKPMFDFPNEEEDVTYECIIVDTDEKQLYTNESIFGLWEQSKDLWKGYNLSMNDYGYLKILEFAGIDTANLKMSHEKVVEQFGNIVKHVNDFDPMKMAEKLLKQDKGIQFNSDFFDNVKPKRTIAESFKQWLRRFLR